MFDLNRCLNFNFTIHKTHLVEFFNLKELIKEKTVPFLFDVYF